MSKKTLIIITVVMAAATAFTAIVPSLSDGHMSVQEARPFLIGFGVATLVSLAAAAVKKA
ncbi:MAG: hypothetical protein LDLANPLL_01373 [Turneriella sp.]|nr:hypothetical protein [Turneriella sp.]